MVLNDADRSPEFQARQSLRQRLDPRPRPHARGRTDRRLGPFDSRLAALVRDRVETLAHRARDRRAGTATCTGSPIARAGSAPRRGLREMNRRARARRRPPAGGLLAAARGPRGRYPFADAARTDRALLPGRGHPAPRPAAALRGAGRTRRSGCTPSTCTPTRSPTAWPRRAWSVPFSRRADPSPLAGRVPL